MAAKRIRVFAGPNGSGKTTIFRGILAHEKVNLGVYVNADDIEKELFETSSLSFSEYGLSISESQVKDFFRVSTFSPVKRNEPDLWTTVNVEHNTFKCITRIDSYLAADLAEFIRKQLLEKDISFTYETVMSHAGKIDFLQQALQKGFRVYLYYIATEDPQINISRVNVRIAQDGHAVAPKVIENRYYKSLGNLKAAVRQTNRAYIFDNSQRQANLIAEITNGIDVVLNKAVDLPYWVAKYLLDTAT
jgi:predicted ABC-type ATPase